MTFKEIKELIDILKDSNLAEFRYKKDDFELNIKTDKFTRKATVASPLATIQHAMPIEDAISGSQSGSGSTDVDASSDGTPSGGNVVEVKSPIVGTFYRSPGPEKDVFVKVGDKIAVGSVVCIVEAMKLFNEIESEVSGTIVKVLVDDASPVEYDQPLFLVEV